MPFLTKATSLGTRNVLKANNFINRLESRSLTTAALQAEKKHYPTLFRNTYDMMSPAAKRTYSGASDFCSRMIPLESNYEDHSSTYFNSKVASVVSARNPRESVINEMVDMAHAFNEVFVKERPDSFIKTLMAANGFDESRCPEVVASPAVMRAWLDNVEDFKEMPQSIGRVLESLLSAAGKSLYQLGQTLPDGTKLCQFDKAGNTADAERLKEIVDLYANQAVKANDVYERGPEGKFKSTNKSIIHNPNEIDNPNDIIYPDAKPLKGPIAGPGRALPGNYFRYSGDDEWIKQAGDAGIHLQYGPSGTTRASLGAIALLKNFEGDAKYFEQGKDEVMGLLVHSVMIPYFKAGYHTPAEVMVAIQCFLDTAQGNDFTPSHALQSLSDAAHYMAEATADGPEKECVGKIWQSITEFSTQLYSKSERASDLTATQTNTSQDVLSQKEIKSALEEERKKGSEPEPLEPTSVTFKK